MRKTLENLERALEELKFVELQNRASEEAQKWVLEFENWIPEVSKLQQDLHADLESATRIAEQMDQNYMTTTNQMLSSIGFGL